MAPEGRDPRREEHDEDTSGEEDGSWRGGRIGAYPSDAAKVDLTGARLDAAAVARDAVPATAAGR